MTAVVESERWKTNPCARCGHAFEAHEGGQDYPCGVFFCGCWSWERGVMIEVDLFGYPPDGPFPQLGDLYAFQINGQPAAILVEEIVVRGSRQVIKGYLR